MKDRLTVEEAERSDGTRVFTLAGKLFGTSEGYGFQDRVRECIASGSKRIVIDLGGVSRVDSSGVGILVSLLFSGYRARGGVVLASIPSNIKDLLRMLMLLERMEHADSVDEAIDKLDAMEAAPPEKAPPG